jgi:hypothetical protein
MTNNKHIFDCCIYLVDLFEYYLQLFVDKKTVPEYHVLESSSSPFFFSQFYCESEYSEECNLINAP